MVPAAVSNMTTRPNTVTSFSHSNAMKPTGKSFLGGLIINGRTPPAGPATWLHEQEANCKMRQNVNTTEENKAKVNLSTPSGIYKTPFHRRGQSSTTTDATGFTISDPFERLAPASESSPISVAESTSWPSVSLVPFKQGPESFKACKHNAFERVVPFKLGSAVLPTANTVTSHSLDSRPHDFGAIGVPIKKHEPVKLSSAALLDDSTDLDIDDCPSEKNIGVIGAPKASSAHVDSEGHRISREAIKAYANATWPALKNKIRKEYPEWLEPPSRICPYVPRTFRQYVEHLEELCDLKMESKVSSDSHSVEKTGDHDSAGTIGVPFKDKIFGANHHHIKNNPLNRGAVLAQETIWCTTPFPDYHIESGWPCLEEQKWEGSSRIATEKGRFGRTMPVPRMGPWHPGWKPAFVDYRRRPFNHGHPFDEVHRLRTREEMHIAVAEVEAHRLYYLINKSLLDEIDNMML
jgi:hypothetical protein